MGVQMGHRIAVDLAVDFRRPRYFFEGADDLLKVGHEIRELGFGKIAQLHRVFLEGNLALAPQRSLCPAGRPYPTVLEFLYVGIPRRLRIASANRARQGRFPSPEPLDVVVKARSVAALAVGGKYESRSRLIGL